LAAVSTQKLVHPEPQLPPLISSHAFFQSVQQNVQSRISNTGYITGYAGGIIMTLIAVAVALSGAAASTATQREKDNASNRSGRIVLLIVGIWWFCFSLCTFYRLGSHPGPSLPSIKDYIILPWTRLFQTFRHIRELPSLSRYLILYFVYSDGFNAIGSVRFSALSVFEHFDASELLTCPCSWVCSLR
jgi:MFS-type transporter involved in bile tolerance (Atg22 family)